MLYVLEKTQQWQTRLSASTVVILLYVCPRTAMLYMCPHTAIYVSSCCYICVLILLYMWQTRLSARTVLILLYISPHATIHVSSYHKKKTAVADESERTQGGGSDFERWSFPTHFSRMLTYADVR
jgi:hypothetical protein